MPPATNHCGGVLITGASTGIGAACALRLAEKGFRVFAGVRSDEAAERLQQQAARPLTTLKLDVTQPHQIADAAERLRRELGDTGLAGLVNNAGVVIAAPLELLPLEELRRQLEVNLVGHLAVTQAMLPLLRAARGRIVNVGSGNGSMSPPFLGAYAASKHALEALNDALRIELRPFGIHVAIVEVGPTQTEIWGRSNAAADALAARVSPEQYALYRRNLDAFREAMQKQAAGAMPVDRPVADVVHALCSRRPKARYFSALSSKFFYRGMRFLPVPIRDWLLRRALGLSDEPSTNPSG